MTCREITDGLDRGIRPEGAYQALRIYLHYAVCKACRHYRAFTRLLRRGARPYLTKTPSHSEIVGFNLRLLDAVRKQED